MDEVKGEISKNIDIVSIGMRGLDGEVKHLPEAACLVTFSGGIPCHVHLIRDNTPGLIL